MIWPAFVEHPIIILRRGNIESDLSVWHMPPILQLISNINHWLLCCFRAYVDVFWRNGCSSNGDKFMSFYEQATVIVNGNIILTLVHIACVRVCVCVQ